jgi:hypothetical protein
MKPVTLNLTMTVSADDLLDLLAQAVEKGTARCTQTVAKGIEQRAVEEKAEIRPKMTPLPLRRSEAARLSRVAHPHEAGM